MKPLPRLRHFWFGETDLAPLGLFRIVYGVLLVWWLLQLLPNLRAFFTDEGIYPRRSLLTLDPDRFSLLNAGGEWWFVLLFWLASLAVALMLLVGYRTRTASLLAFLAVGSFLGRNPLIMDGSDFVYRLIPFWLIFTPAGDRFALDAAIRRARGDPPGGCGPALPIRLLELQIAWIYLATGLEKIIGKTWQDGTAVYYALQLSHTFGRPWSEPLAFNEPFVRLVTWGTLVLELAFLPLAFSPVLNRVTRFLVVVSAAMLHVGILALMNVGNFPWIMLACLILFLPAATVDCLVARANRLLAARGVLHRVPGVKRLAERLYVPVTEWYPLILDRPDNARKPHGANRPSAASRSTRRSFTWLRRLGYGLISLVALAAFATALPAWLKAYRTPDPYSRVLVFSSLSQQWNMFSPDPSRSDGWMLAPARLKDGTEFDLLTGGPPSAEPRFAKPLYSRWQKVYERLANRSYSEYRAEFGRSFCRMRNWHLQAGQSPLDSFELTYVERMIEPPGGGQPVIRRHQLWSHTC